MTFLIIFILLFLIAEHVNKEEARKRQHIHEELNKQLQRKARGLKAWEIDTMPDTFPDAWTKTETK